MSVETKESAEVFARPGYRSERDTDGYRVEVRLPGVPKKSVEVHVDDGVLTVTGRRSVRVPESWRPIHEELGKPNYQLKLRLGDDVDEDGIGAVVEEGVLSLTLPVREASRPRVVAIA